ncbi:MAG TPA: bile acid:sodium symporter family protein, partial [Verrucomicrobiae bacterium]|nr:bile acid:sodium symporter family protein [Verrucomicrobiae bacterium]
TFLFFPLLGLVLLKLCGKLISPDLRLGFFYLCALPSTVSSSVAMTSAAHGNVPGAVFNATLSSLLGVFLTPLWMGWMLRGIEHPVPMLSVIEDLLLWLVLPLVVGQLCRPWLGNWVHRHKKSVHKVDRGTILLLVYTSFCDSMKWGVWTKHGPGTVAVALAGTLVLFWIALLATSAVSDALGLPFADKVTAVFCGSKKTLASGIPMAQLIFGSYPGISLVLIPIMIYHPLQLVICGVIAGRWAKRVAGMR